MEDLARRLMFEYRLNIAGEIWTITELEGYLYDKNGHPDEFVHRDPQQLEMNTWYFHRRGRTYKGGTFKGLDMTFGEKDLQIYFGMLIRAIDSPQGLIEGPCNVVDYMLYKTQKGTIKGLVTSSDFNLNDIYDPHSIVHLEPYTDGYKEEPILKRTARVGLTLNILHPREEDEENEEIYRAKEQYIGKKYRFITQAYHKPKKHLLYLGCTENPKQHEEFKKGKEMSLSSFRNKHWTVGETCQMLGAWEAKFGSPE